jgi:hypothetical protein
MANKTLPILIKRSKTWYTYLKKTFRVPVYAGMEFIYPIAKTYFKLINNAQ